MYFFLPRFFISRETDGKIRKRLPAERRAADNFPEIESLGIIIRKKQSLYSRLQGKFNTKYQNCRDMSLERSAERDENYFYTEYGFQDSKTKRLTPRSITNETIFHLFGSRFIEYIGSSPFPQGREIPRSKNLSTVSSLRCDIQRHSSREGAIISSILEERKQAARIDLISRAADIADSDIFPLAKIWIDSRHRVGNRPPVSWNLSRSSSSPLSFGKNPIYTPTRVEDLVWGGGGNNVEHPWNVARNRYGLRPPPSPRLEDAQPAARGMCV